MAQRRTSSDSAESRPGTSRGTRGPLVCAGPAAHVRACVRSTCRSHAYGRLDSDIVDHDFPSDHDKWSNVVPAPGCDAGACAPVCGAAHVCDERRVAQHRRALVRGPGAAVDRPPRRTAHQGPRRVPWSLRLETKLAHDRQGDGQGLWRAGLLAGTCPTSHRTCATMAHRRTPTR